MSGIWSSSSAHGRLCRAAIEARRRCYQNGAGGRDVSEDTNAAPRRLAASPRRGAGRAGDGRIGGDADGLAGPARPPDAGGRREKIAYGPGPMQFADLWLPAGKGPFPVVLMVHGGCWLSRRRQAQHHELRRRGPAPARHRGLEHRIPRRRPARAAAIPGRSRMSRPAPTRWRRSRRPITCGWTMSSRSATRPAATWCCGWRRARGCRPAAR